MIVQSWDCWNLDTKLSCQIDPQGALKLEYKKKNLGNKSYWCEMYHFLNENPVSPLFVCGGRILETHYCPVIVESCPAPDCLGRTGNINYKTYTGRPDEKANYTSNKARQTATLGFDKEMILILQS